MLCAVQIVGGIFGSLMVSALMPKAYIGMGDGGPGKLQPFGTATAWRAVVRLCQIACCWSKCGPSVCARLLRHDVLFPKSSCTHAGRTPELRQCICVCRLL